MDFHVVKNLFQCYDYFMAKHVIFSGIQPSGNLHIGNYIGAISQWVSLQNNQLSIINDQSTLKSKNDQLKVQPELLFCVVDLHAITVPQDPSVLREKILEVAALYLACGLDPKRVKIFIQSENLDHSYLAWIFDCFLPTGWLARMTQFKDKAQRQAQATFDVAEATTMGLFNYPALMAADILLYDTDLVPVGEDQVQHVELARDIAKKINSRFGEIFKLPKVMLDKQAARIMSLSDPSKKMSKSDVDPSGTINLLDSEEDIRRKIKHAVTDSGDEIVFRYDKPAISNLLVIYSKFSGREISEIEKEYKGKGYSDFKSDLANVVVSALKPIQDKYREIRSNEVNLNEVLDQGLKFARQKSSQKISVVKEAVGLGR